MNWTHLKLACFLYAFNDTNTLRMIEDDDDFFDFYDRDAYDNSYLHDDPLDDYNPSREPFYYSTPGNTDTRTEDLSLWKSIVSLICVFVGLVAFYVALIPVVYLFHTLVDIVFSVIYFAMSLVFNRFTLGLLVVAIIVLKIVDRPRSA